MGLFGFGKKKEWDLEKSEQNKAKLRTLFNSVLPDGNTWKVLYGYTEDIKNMNYILARKTTYTYGSLIIGYRESDMSIALMQTVPELDGCSDEPMFFRKDNIKKAKSVIGMYTIFHKGGMMAGFTQFSAIAENDEKFLAYVYQPDEFNAFEAFFKKFSGK